MPIPPSADRGSVCLLAAVGLPKSLSAQTAVQIFFGEPGLSYVVPRQKNELSSSVCSRKMGSICSVAWWPRKNNLLRALRREGRTFWRMESRIHRGLPQSLQAGSFPRRGKANRVATSFIPLQLTGSDGWRCESWDYNCSMWTTARSQPGFPWSVPARTPCSSQHGQYSFHPTPYQKLTRWQSLKGREVPLGGFQLWGMARMEMLREERATRKSHYTLCD